MIFLEELVSSFGIIILSDRCHNDGVSESPPIISTLQGRATVKKLEASNDWSKVIAVSRKPLDFESKAQRISLDLNDKGVRDPATTAVSSICANKRDLHTCSSHHVRILTLYMLVRHSKALSKARKLETSRMSFTSPLQVGGWILT